MLSTAVMSFFGFFFWMINARVYNPKDVGFATTIITSSSLLANLSLFGLNNSLVHFLPRSKDKFNLIFTCLITVAVSSIFITTIYLATINKYAVSLQFIGMNMNSSFVFILLVVLLSLNNLLDSVFIAQKKSINVLTRSSILSIVKVILPIFLVSFYFLGIILSFVLALLLSLIVGLMLLYRKEFPQSFSLQSFKLITVIKYSFSSYFINIMISLPMLLLPAIITHKIGAQYSAYYYMDIMIVNLLFIIPGSVTNTFFAEGSYNNVHLREIFLKALKLTYVLLIPGIACIIVFGYWILLSFGEIYAKNGYPLLVLFSLSGIFYATNNLLLSIFRIRNYLKPIIIINLFGATIIIFLSTLLIDQTLTGIGTAWLIGQIIILLSYLFIFFNKVKI